MTSSQPSESTRWFRIFDKAFWLIWLGFPLMMWLVYLTNTNAPQIGEQLPTEYKNCVALMPTPQTMQGLSAAIFWGMFVFNFSIYVIVLTVFHVIVHRFACGQIYVSETLASLQLVAIALIAWPFLDSLVQNAGLYALHQRGDLPIYLPNMVIDIGPVAIGVFLLAIKLMLNHAIALKSEHDLTI